MSLAEELAHGVAELGLSVPADTQRKLLDYVALITKWNRVHNLTSARAGATIVSNHLLDSLAVAPYLEARMVLDVGSGGGCPGIPLALLWPQARVTLLDSNHKKAAFLTQAVIELKLSNAAVVCERVETWLSPHLYDLVISRAFSDLPDFLELAGRHCTARGTLAAMKGVYPHQELARLPQGYKLKKIVECKVPGLRAERHLVLLTPER